MVKLKDYNFMFIVKINLKWNMMYMKFSWLKYYHSYDLWALLKKRYELFDVVDTYTVIENKFS